MVATCQPAAAVLVKEWTWKSPAMRAMTLAVCRLSLDRGVNGSFSALDLAEHGAEQHGGTGIAGSVFRILVDAEILAPVGAWVDGEFVQKRVRNAGGNPIGVWRLAHAEKARALLRAHGQETAVAVQAELRF